MVSEADSCSWLDRTWAGWDPLDLVRWSACAALWAVAALLVHGEVSRPALPDGVEAYTDIVYRRVGHRWEKVDIYVPAGPAPSRGWPTILAIHGGGWRGGSRANFGREIARLAQHGYVVVSASYLLSATGHPSWPENLEDLRAAVRWMRKHAGDYGIDPNRIAALGASAGGHLAVLLGTDPDTNGSARVEAVVDFYGPCDLKAMAAESPIAEPALIGLLGGLPRDLPDRYEAASPLHYVSRGDAPTLLIHGLADMLVPPTQSVELAQAMAGAGVRQRLILIPGAWHGFGLRASGRDLVPEILDFLEGVWKDKRDHP